MGPDLKAEPRAFGHGAVLQDDGVVLDRIRQIYRVALFGDQSEAENVRVVLGLLVQIRSFVAGVGYLPHTDHTDGSL